MDDPPAQTDRVTAFLTTHTTLDNDDVPLLEECPICLESYSSEPRSRITGIGGCAHHIGAKCLEEMLRSHPNEEKRCPLCRTMWIPAPRAPGASVSEQMAEITVALYGIGASIAFPIDSDRNGLNRYHVIRPQYDSQFSPRPVDGTDLGSGIAYVPAIPTRRAPRPAPQPFLGDSDPEEEDYETQFQNYEEFTRDIENIRTRARGTVLGSHWRRLREPEMQRSASATTRQTRTATNDSIGRSATSASTGRGAGAMSRFLNRNLQPFRPSATDTVASEPSSNTAVPPGDQNEVTGFPRNRVQSSQDATRAREFSLREEGLLNWAADLREREMALVMREQVISIRERELNRRTAALQRQNTEMQIFLRRQQHALERQ